MRNEQVRAFVLTASDYGDSDRIVALFTLEHGRIKAFARGARKSRKRFRAALEPFARVEAQIRIKEGLAALHQADISAIYPAVRRSLAGIAHALYACELVDCLTPEGLPLPRLYRLLAAYLDHLETGVADEEGRRFFELNLINILGYRPALETCARCDTPFGAGGALLQEEGELTCRACQSRGTPLSAATLAVLKACLGTGRFGQVSFSGETLVQAGTLLDRAITAHAGRRLKSLEFLRQADL